MPISRESLSLDE